MKKLLFIYNADANLAAAIKDGLTKVLLPDKYPCSLCQITYGLVFMKKEWRDFIQSLPYKIEFLHKDEFQKIHGNSYRLPAVFVLREDNSIQEIISANEIEKVSDVKSLKELVKNKLKDSSV